MNDDLICCQDVHCKDEEHIKATDDLIVVALDSIDKAASKALYQVDCKNSEPKNVPIPGWSETVHIPRRQPISGTRSGSLLDVP